MINVDHESVAEFIMLAQQRLAWMEEELARLRDEGDRRALLGAREELVQMMLALANGRTQ